MAWCTRETNFKFGYLENKSYQKMTIDKIREHIDELSGWRGNMGREGRQILQGALAGAVAREYGISLLPPECYDPAAICYYGEE